MSTSPTVVVNVEKSQLLYTTQSPVNFTVTFDQAVTDFDSSKLTLGGTTGANSVFVLGSGAVYNVIVSGMSVTGDLTVSIAAGTVHNASNDANLVSTTTLGNTVHFSTTALPNTTAPAGAFKQFTNTMISGFAYDVDYGSSPIEILYQIDNKAPQRVTASVNRPDFPTLVNFGSTNHGFTVFIPQLTAGTHTATVWAVDPTTLARVSLGSRTLTVANPVGNALPVGVLGPGTSTSLAAGWAYDPNTSASIQVRIDIDGVQGIPFTASNVRTDLAKFGKGTAHGFSQALTLSPGPHRIDLYALDSTSSLATLIDSRWVGTSTATQGLLEGTVGSTQAGWLFNSGLGAIAAIGRLKVDGVVGTVFEANITRVDLISLGSIQHGLSVSLPALATGSHTVVLQYIDPFTLLATNVNSKNIVV